MQGKPLAPKRRAAPYLWSFLQQGAEQVLFIAVSVLLARLLTPTDFGLVAMVSAVTGFAGVLLDLGFGNALVHKKDLDQTDRSTAFYANVAISGSMSLLLFFGAPMLAAFYGEPRLVFLARLLCWNFVLSGFAVVDSAILRRALNFRSLALASVVASLGGGVVGVTLAALGHGATALAAQVVTRALLNAALLRAQSGFSPTWAFSRESLRGMVRYGRGILGANALNYWARNTDNLLIGKWLGSAELGIYNRAYALMLLPMNVISRVVSNVLFPVLMKSQGDHVEMRAEFLRTCRRVAFVSFPLMAGMAVTADPLVRTLFGERWVAVIPLLQALAPLGLYQSVISLYGPIYLALGKTDLDFKVSIFVESTLIGAIVIGARWGVPGVIVGLYAASAINFLPTNLISLRLIGLPLLTMARGLLPPFLATLLMSAVVLAAGTVLRDVAAPLRLFAQVTTGALAYSGASRLLRVDTMSEAWAELSKRLRARRQET